MNHACRIAVLLALLVPATRARAQFADYTDHEGWPEGPIAALGRDLIAAINAESTAAYLGFLEVHAAEWFRVEIPEAQHIAVYRQIRDETRGLDYHGYRTYDPPRPDGEHVLIARGRLAGAWHGIVVQLSAEAPDRFDGLRVLPARPPSNLPPEPPLDRAGAARELDDFLTRLADADAFSGTVLLAHDGEPFYERACGLASRRFGVSNLIDTKFNIGSMNKMFTAVAIAQLVEAGRMSFDDPLSTYLDESWLPADVADAILVRHVLNHTSGLGSYFNETFMNGSRARFRVVDDYKPLVESELAFEPGTGWRYSNTGFLLAGAVIEKVTGERHDDWVRDHVFEPAGMTDTDCYEMDLPVKNLAIGYVPEYDEAGERVWRNNLFMHVVKGGPAGGGFSTAPDLLKFDRAMRSGALVSAAMRAELWRPRPDASSPDYGYGFAVGEGPLGATVGHGGGFPGISARLDMHLDTGWTVIVLSNQSGGTDAVAQKIETLLARVE